VILRDFLAKFWNGVAVTGTDECWNWTAWLTPCGYGAISSRGRTHRANRVSWELHNREPIPAGMFVLHSCDNRACVNPAHLRLGTARDNAQDAKSRKRWPQQRQTHCQRGHEFTPENTFIRATGRRSCRLCLLLNQRRRRNVTNPRKGVIA
jgi:hypothetical protein